MRVLIALLLLTANAYAGSIDVSTGYGYFKDENGNVVAKSMLPPGEHPMKDGYEYVEVADASELESIEVYRAPKSQVELDLDLIDQKLREMAVSEIRKTRPAFKDPIQARNP